MMEEKIEINFVKLFFRLSLPVILSELILLLANNVSMAMLGSLSEKAIGGFSVANEAFNIYSMLILGLVGGIHVYIAQFYGSSNREKYNQVLRFGIKMAFGAGLIFNVALFVFAEPFTKLFVSDAETISYAIPYIRIFSLTFIPYAVNLVCSGSYSIIGKAKVALMSGGLNCLMNLGFCWLLIYGKLFFPKMGIEGAAVALLIARLAESAFLFYVMNRQDSIFRLTQAFPSIHAKDQKRILGTSLPLIFNEALFSIAFMFIFLNYSYTGEKFLPCVTIVTMVCKLVFVPATGSSAAIGVLVGGKLGSNKLDEAKVNATKIIRMCLSIVIMGCFVIAILSPIIPHFFSLEGELYDMAVKMLLVKAGCSLLGGITMVFYNILRVGGDTKSVFILDGCFSCCGPLVMSVLFSRVFHAPFLWLFFAVEFMNVIKTCLGFYFFKRGKWIAKLS